MSAQRKSILKPRVTLRTLRVAFLSLGAGLLVALFALFFFVQERLAEARVEREQMVASRVFDEMEREISAFLDGEAERAHYLSLKETDPKTWSPFVVGYFKHEGLGPDVVTDGGEASENHRRVLWALDQSSLGESVSGPEVLEKSLEEEEPGAHDSGAAEKSGALPPPRNRAVPASRKKSKISMKSAPKRKPTPVMKAAPKAKKSSSGSEIIQQLNRAQERRKAPKKESAPQAPESESDQFQDYTEAY